MWFVILFNWGIIQGKHVSFLPTVSSSAKSLQKISSSKPIVQSIKKIEINDCNKYAPREKLDNLQDPLKQSL